MPQILVVDDEKKMRHLLSIMLERKGYTVEQAGDGREAYEAIRAGGFDMVITDIKMPRMDGIELLRKITGENLSCPVIFITAFATVESAVDVMRMGAVDYITKPFEEDKILMTVERTLNVSRILAENAALKQELKKAAPEGEIVYVSREMASVMGLAAKVAETDSAVLIIGESGTGKELLARYIHEKSHRNGGRFVPVNCAAISPNLVESELFGHEKGAFTGADRRAKGKFEFASGGTIFLDEIGDLPLEAQAKMLRALQDKKIQRIGKNEEIPVDVRVVCATNRNLEELVDTGDFRQDLFYRINVFPLEPPPLRDRMDDVLPLAEHFLGRMVGKSGITLDPKAATTLMAYAWPGNVRELANAMERAVILAGDGGMIGPDTLSFLRTSGGRTCEDPAEFPFPKEGFSLEKFEKDLVRKALETANNNQAAAARLLGLSRGKFRILMKQAEM